MWMKQDYLLAPRGGPFSQAAPALLSKRVKGPVLQENTNWTKYFLKLLPGRFASCMAPYNKTTMSHFGLVEAN